MNAASVHGLVGSVHKAAFVAAKHGFLDLTKVTALETERTSVTCNPGEEATSRRDRADRRATVPAP